MSDWRDSELGNTLGFMTIIPGALIGAYGPGEGFNVVGFIFGGLVGFGVGKVAGNILTGIWILLFIILDIIIILARIGAWIN